MALHIVESNRVRVLLAELDRRLGPLDLFEKRTVLVPGRHFFSVVKNSLAAARGACFQVEVLTFDAWLARQARSTGSDAGVADVGPVDPDSLAAACFQELAFSERLRDPDFADLRAYLTQGSEQVQTDVAWQVSRQLGDLYLRYHLERPALIAAWTQGRTFTDSPLERAQMSLLSGVLRAAGALGAFEFAADRVRAGGGLAAVVGALHVLVPNPWPLRDREFLATLGDHADVFLYLFTPCQEFFEQVRRVRRVTDAEAPFTGNHPLLDAWGAPLAEPVTWCHETSGYQTRTLFEDPGSSTNLARVQQAVLDNREDLVLDGPDDSLRVWRFASRREECVAVRDDLVARLQADPGLRLCDFAVVVPEAGDGPAAIDEIVSVFAEEPALPLHRVRWRSDSESQVLQTMDQLLALPSTRGRATEVLELACRPTLGGWTREQERLVRRWIVSSGAVRGWRDADLVRADPRLRTNTWERALWRLSLGAVAAPGAALSLEVPGAGTVGLRPLDFSADQWPLLSRVLTIVHGLRDFCEACGPPRTMAGWMELLGEALPDLITPQTERDEKLLAHGLEILKQHASRPIWRLRDPLLTYEEMLPIVSADLAGLRTGHSPWGERNVWVGTIADLGLLPFSHVYFVGLEDGAVARELAVSPLDVRTLEGIPGHEPAARETELAQFLAALCHVRGSVTFSWCDRNPASGDMVAPATIVRELIEAADPRGRALAQSPTAPVVLRSARVEAAADRIAAEKIDWAALPEGVPAADQLREFLRRPAPLSPQEDAGRMRRLRWRDLSRFWQFPLQVTARTWFISKDEEPETPLEQEPDGLKSWMITEWFSQIVARELGTGTDPDEAGLLARLEQDVADYLRAAAAQGWGPVGVFGDALAGKLLADLRKTVSLVLGAVQDHLPDRSSWSGFHTASPGMDPALVPDATPPIRPGRSACLVSGRLPLYHPRSGLLLMLDFGGDKSEWVELVCDAWVALLLHVLAAPEAPSGPVRVLLVRPSVAKARQVRSWEWPLPDPVLAGEQVAALADALHDPENLAFLTVKMAQDWRSGRFRDFEAWYVRRASSLLETWESDPFADFRLDPLWNLAPLIDAPRAWSLAQRIYLDPEAPVARQFQTWILPALTTVSGGTPLEGTQEGADDPA